MLGSLSLSPTMSCKAMSNGPGIRRSASSQHHNRRRRFCRCGGTLGPALSLRGSRADSRRVGHRSRTRRTNPVSRPIQSSRCIRAGSRERRQRLRLFKERLETPSLTLEFGATGVNNIDYRAKFCRIRTRWKRPRRIFMRRSVSSRRNCARSTSRKVKPERVSARRRERRRSSPR